MLDSPIQNPQNLDVNFSANVPFTDKNHVDIDQSNHLWDQINLSQQFAVCSLGQFGYLLTSTRSVAGQTLAILKKNDKVATVNSAGIINVSPTINCP